MTGTTIERVNAIPPWSLILLTGGEGTRLGADKSNVSVGGVTSAQRIVKDVPADVPIIVVGSVPAQLGREVRVTCETPPGGGPVAGIAAGLEYVQTDLVAVLATDMPFAAPVLPALAAALAPDFDGILAVDQSGRQQYLCAMYQTASLRSALAGDTRNMAMYAALGGLHLHTLPHGARLLDIDTPDDLEQARVYADLLEHEED
jgi:molybdopterin-guanine dinucleotide biosynthesis protein A